MEKERKMKLMRDGNAFYEVDEECLRRGLNQEGQEERDGRRTERGNPNIGRRDERNPPY